MEADPVEVVRRGYDALSHRYRGDDDRPAEYATWATEVVDALPAGARVLDVGCGNGIPLARDLAAAGLQVTGVDLSQVQVDRARALVLGATFLCADVTELPMPAASFEAVVALYSVIHVPLDRQPALLRQFARWLVPGGLLLLVTGQDAWTGSDPAWLGGDTAMVWSHADAATSRTWLVGAGFEVEREEFVPEGDGGHALFRARRRP